MNKSTFYHPIFHGAYKRISPLIKSKKSIPYLTLTLTFLSLSFFGIFAIRPTITTAISLYKSVSDLQKLNIDYENKIGNLIRAQSEYEQIRNDLILIDTALPVNTDFSKIAKSLEKFAELENISINHIQIDNSSVSKLPPSDKYTNFNFSFIGTGSYSSVFSFISHLLNWKRIVNINSLDLTKEGASTSALLRLNLKASAYYEP